MALALLSYVLCFQAMRICQFEIGDFVRHFEENPKGVLSAISILKWQQKWEFKILVSGH